MQTRLLAVLFFSFVCYFDSSRAEAKIAYAEAFHTVTTNSVLIRSRVLANGNYGFCSGVVLNPTTVLTAAHCIEGNDRHEIQTPGRFFNKWVQATESHISPDYHPLISPSMSDIGVLTFSDPLSYDAVSICEKDHGKEVLTQSGFGWRDGRHARTEVFFTADELKPTSKLVIGFDSLGVAGDSGAPVFALENGLFCLYAIHSSVSAPLNDDGTPNTSPRKTYNPIIRKTNLPVKLF